MYRGAIESSSRRNRLVAELLSDLSAGKTYVCLNELNYSMFSPAQEVQGQLETQRQHWDRLVVQAVHYLSELGLATQVLLVGPDDTMAVHTKLNSVQWVDFENILEVAKKKASEAGCEILEEAQIACREILNARERVDSSSVGMLLALKYIHFLKNYLHASLIS